MAKNGERVRRGTWTKEEDILLRKCIETYGQGNWHKVPLRAGLNRCRKSCRLRWMNYLRPTIKRGHFNKDEVDLILRLHKLIGNRWSLIAGRLPGRTANDIKNFWNSHIAKKLLAAGNSCKLKTAHDDETVTKCNIIKPRPRKLTISKSQVLACPSEVNNYADEPNDENIKNKQPFSSASLSQEGPNDWTNSDGNDKKNETSDQSLSIEEVNECSHKWWSSLLGISEIGEGTSFSFSDDY